MASDVAVVERVATLGAATQEHIGLTCSIVGMLGTLLAASLWRARQAHVGGEQSPATEIRMSRGIRIACEELPQGRIGSFPWGRNRTSPNRQAC